MSHQSVPPHLSEETLILQYYGEAEDTRAVEAHLASCASCREEFDRLRHVLGLVDVEDVPEPGPGFERDVWARLVPQLETRKASWLSWLVPAGPKWAYAGGVAALLLVAFMAGRFSNPAVPSAPGSTATATPAAAGDFSQRILVVAVVDHLDRSQMMLVELLNADPGATLDLGSEQTRARELVAENRLYRVSAAQAGDEAMGSVLDELERVLLEIANTPRDASAGDLEALRQRIDARGLLFKVRVVHSEMRERERQTVIAGSTS
jgi:hypothetical protein